MVHPVSILNASKETTSIHGQVKLKTLVSAKSTKLSKAAPAQHLNEWPVSNLRYCKQPESFLPDEANLSKFNRNEETSLLRSP